MNIDITFEKTARYFGEGQAPTLKVWMKFSGCTYDAFQAWIDSHAARLEGKSVNIAHSDKVLYFS